MTITNAPCFISQDIHNKYPKTHLKVGDLIMSVRGEVGKVGIIDDRFNNGGNINANTIRISLSIHYKSHKVNQRFIWLALNSQICQKQIYRILSGGVQNTITAPEILSILIPYPKNQNGLVQKMDAARARRREKLAQANELLASLDQYLLDTLGIKAPPEDMRSVFSVLHKKSLFRLDPYFHSPKFIQLNRILSLCNCVELSNIVELSIETWNPALQEEFTFKYIEISGVDLKTGIASYNEILTTEAPSRARMKLTKNDIIVSLTRPHHGAVAKINDELKDCIASTGFAIIRNVNEKLIIRDYLWCILRSKLCLKQMLQRSSGGNYPAITESELLKITVPCPELNIQKKIVNEVLMRQQEARRLRAEAETEWDAAKRWFEEQLLGPAAA